ncbi:MAG: hypothetical protein H6535_10230 [Bacteroidia bacterium]|nr:hypothetical protein [Bacteroidia bacterium]
MSPIIWMMSASATQPTKKLMQTFLTLKSSSWQNIFRTPTGRGTDGFEGPQTSKRGNYRKTDGYAYLSLELAYKINFNWGKLKGHF